MQFLTRAQTERGFAVVTTYMPEHRHIETVIDLPGKKIYLNRAADQAANVVQVRFSSAFQQTGRIHPQKQL